MRAFGECLARVGLFVVGTVMCLGPCVAVLRFSWTAVPLLTFAMPGVVLVVLAAFHGRIQGTIKLGRFFEVPIGPPREAKIRPSTPARRRVRGST